MERMTDTHIRQSLKNWASNQHPPSNGRARLLLIASVTATGDQPGAGNGLDARMPVDLVRSRLPMYQASGSFYQPLLWVLHFNMTTVKNVT